MAPDDGRIRDSRGLARALTGDIAGAISDFEAYIAWAEAQKQNDGQIQQRKDWIEALKLGQNPFSETVLKSLRGQ